MTPTTAAAGPARTTRQRAAVSELLDRLDGFRSAQDIHDLLRRDGATIGLATVYRALQALADNGDVELFRAGSGEATYRRCTATTRRHCHLVCRQCGLAVEVRDPDIERWTRVVTDTHGFTAVSAAFDIVGLCDDCTNPGPAARPKESQMS